MSDLIHILHLSDLQFTGQSDVDPYRTNLAADLKSQAVESLTYLVISGDVARQGKAEQYAQAADFVNKLAQQLGLQKDHIIVTPGNHDIDWALSKSAYDFKRTEELPDNFSPDNDKFIPAGGIGGLLRNDAQYPQRFQPFSQHFYQPVTGSAYPLDTAQQGIVKPYSDDKILFLTLNSAWKVDDHFTDRAAINPRALSSALDAVMAGAYDDWLKIAVWHHSVSGPRAMHDASFLAHLAQQKFQLGLYGHIQNSDEGFYSYNEQQRNLHLVGAGCFGDPTTSGRPFRYHLLTWNQPMQQLTIDTRRRETQSGVWQSASSNRINFRQDTLAEYPRPPISTVLTEKPTIIHIEIFGSSNTAEAASYRIRLRLPEQRTLSSKRMTLNPEELKKFSDRDAYGRYLGKALFSDQGIRTNYDQAVAIIQKDGGSPQVMLHLDNDVLAEVRWERLYHPIDGNWSPIASSAQTPFSRHISLDSVPPRPITAKFLRVLVVIASPDNLEEFGLTPISTAERGQVKAIFAGLPGVEPTFLESETSAAPTLDNLKRELAKDYHLVHFLCHGTQGKTSSYLYLENAGGQVDPVSADKLIGVFTGLQPPPLFCFLAACESGAQNKNNAEAFVPLGPELVRRGKLGAVVAMSEKISLATAATFTSQFYTRLLMHGQVDLAVNEARYLVKENWDWSVPVLFSRLMNNQLLALDDESKPIQPSRQPSIPEVHPSGEGLEVQLKALSEEKLNTRCYDCGPEVYNKLKSGTRKQRKIDLLLEYDKNNP